MGLLAKKMAVLAVVNQPAVNLDATLTLQSFVAGPRLEIRGTGELLRTLLSHVGVTDNWVDNALQGGTYGAFFEVRLTQSAGTAPLSGPSLATFHTINTEVEWEWAETDEFDGTLDIREIANTGNTATATIDVNDNP